MIKNSLYFCAVGLIVVAALHAPKVYSVSHTEPEWGQTLSGINETQRIVHKSDLPAHEAFYVDSVLNNLQNDIYRQVIEQKRLEADTTHRKAKP